MPQIVIEGQPDPAHRVRLTVSDNGPGVPAAVAPRIFLPFFTTKAHGTGLGLALVQKIIVTHNGRVTVANDDGGGARFMVTLPIAPVLIALRAFCKEGPRRRIRSFCQINTRHATYSRSGFPNKKAAMVRDRVPRRARCNVPNAWLASIAFTPRADSRSLKF